MAQDLDHPGRVVGFHFFNPVAVLPLVEVVRAERTDGAALATAFAVGRKLKKSCVLVKDAPAFVFNRLISRALAEVLSALDAGTPAPVADASVEPLGMPMPPSALLQLVGPAIALHTSETLHDAFPDRFAVSAGLRAMVSGDPLSSGNSPHDAAGPASSNATHCGKKNFRAAGTNGVCRSPRSVLFPSSTIASLACVIADSRVLSATGMVGICSSSSAR